MKRRKSREEASMGKKGKFHLTTFCFIIKFMYITIVNIKHFTVNKLILKTNVKLFPFADARQSLLKSAQEERKCFQSNDIDCRAMIKKGFQIETKESESIENQAQRAKSFSWLPKIDLELS